MPKLRHRKMQKIFTFGKVNRLPDSIGEAERDLHGVLAGSHGTQGRLRRVPIESVDFLNAGVAN